ncbi:hypothetical protein CRG98_048178 [Punica granatum]|uniref:Uncharacterized protein n=1 Tax=Punica granatum TaxID=22663 RepID=A0A2I0HIC0_PUNGR|nr:hypothetical protein CRG98_048178 [Punica granatum]
MAVPFGWMRAGRGGAGQGRAGQVGKERNIEIESKELLGGGCWGGNGD